MRSNVKTKIIVLIVLGIVFALSSTITSSLNFYTIKSDDNNFDSECLKFSAVSGKIDINGNSGWANAKTAGICTGNGTYSAPYIIEDLIIDGGGSGSCILIENSNVYFRIENCSVYNSGNFWSYAGIRLYNVDNGQLINNNCSSNNYGGIYLQNSDNNTVSANFVNNSRYGIYLENSKNNTISGNVLIEQGFIIYGNLETLLSNKIDLTNQVNGKPLYYYDNEVNLEPNNFSNAGQVILVNCNDSLISNLNISYSSRGISLHYCSNNTISGNIFNNNILDGIYLRESSNNTISGNTATNNNIGIYLYSSDDNIFSGNTANNNDEYGIYLTSCDSNTFSDNAATNNNIGIYLYSSDDNILSGNTANNNNQDGIYLTSCDSSTFSNNNANNNSRDGIYIQYSDSSTLSNNNANNNSRNGIYLYRSNNNDISRNTLNNNIGDGIYLEVSQRNIITFNTITHNSVGIYLGFSSNHNNVSRNNVSYNNYGISLLVSDDNTISFNTITHSSVGIYLKESNSNEISNNIFTDNGVDIKNETVEFILLIVIIIIISTVIVVTGILIRKRRRSKDEVAKFYKQKEQEKQLKDGVELNDKKPSTPREVIIRKAGEANENEEEYINLPGWSSSGRSLSLKSVLEVFLGIIGLILLFSGFYLIGADFGFPTIIIPFIDFRFYLNPFGITFLVLGAVLLSVAFGEVFCCCD